jgi:hypothetical protein
MKQDYGGGTFPPCVLLGPASDALSLNATVVILLHVLTSWEWSSWQLIYGLPKYVHAQPFRFFTSKTLHPTRPYTV